MRTSLLCYFTLHGPFERTLRTRQEHEEEFLKKWMECVSLFSALIIVFSSFFQQDSNGPMDEFLSFSRGHRSVIHILLTIQGIAVIMEHIITQCLLLLFLLLSALSLSTSFVFYSPASAVIIHVLPLNRRGCRTGSSPMMMMATRR